MVTIEQINGIIEKEKSKFLQRYTEIVNTPSVSSQKEHAKDCRKTAEIAKKFLLESGATQAEIFETAGHPTVWGRFENDPKGPTIAIYNHLDVQPAEKGQNGWTMEPFNLTEKNGRFYSRGSTDDKGPAMTALWAASMAKSFGIKTNVEFIWELEEEDGSPNFHEAVTQIKKVSKADFVVVSDTVWLSPEQPAMTKSLRGLLGINVTLTTAEKETHSGLTGGAARNPITELCQMVSKCVDANTGEIIIPGFEKTWERPSKELLNDFVNTGFDVARFKKVHGLTHLRSDKTEDVVAAIWAKPTFEVHGIDGGYTGEGIKTIVPNKARALISMRLVPGQDIQAVVKVVKDFIEKTVKGAEVVVMKDSKPFSAPMNTPINTKIQDAIEFAFGKRPVYAAEGGSIGAVVTMNEMLEVPVYFMGLSLPEDNYHGPDESFAWRQIEGGSKAFVKLFESMAKA